MLICCFVFDGLGLICSFNGLCLLPSHYTFIVCYSLLVFGFYLGWGFVWFMFVILGFAF